MIIGSIAGKIFFVFSCANIDFISALAHGTAFPLSKLKIIELKISSSMFLLVLLIFGNLTDTFTNRSFDLCEMNFTMFDSVCPPDVQLTPDNFLTQYT
jgi:hypothetical protein